MINFIDLQEFFTFYFLTSVFDKQSVLAFHEKFCFLPFWKIINWKHYAET